jgi:hypothetical protein
MNKHQHLSVVYFVFLILDMERTVKYTGYVGLIPGRQNAWQAFTAACAPYDVWGLGKIFYADTPYDVWGPLGR